MDNEFVTQAIENDRCLKAYRLLKRFEDEIEALVGRMGEEMIAARPDRFPEDVSGRFRANRDSGTIIANARENFEMRVVNEDDTSANMKLNVSVRWVDPLDWTKMMSTEHFVRPATKSITETAMTTERSWRPQRTRS